jgi:hypothetical protein
VQLWGSAIDLHNFRDFSQQVPRNKKSHLFIDPLKSATFYAIQ